MKNNTNPVPFEKAFLTGLFVGMIATLFCFVYDIWFRMATLYVPSDFINVSSIIFIVNILLMLAGIAYYAFKSWSKNGNTFYTLFCLLVTAFCIWKITGIHRFTEIKLNREFIQLLGGTLIIIAIAVLSVPFIYGNKKIVNWFYEAAV